MSERWLALLAAPVLLVLPFLLFAGGDPHGGATPHADHTPRHGGRLLMLGDQHVEIVEGAGGVELYVSDALRRPLRPASGRAIAADGSAQPLAWEQGRLVSRAPAPVRHGTVRYEIVLDTGALLDVPAH